MELFSSFSVSCPDRGDSRVPGSLGRDGPRAREWAPSAPAQAQAAQAAGSRRHPAVHPVSFLDRPGLRPGASSMLNHC